MVNNNAVLFTDSIIELLNDFKEFRCLKANWDGEGACAPNMDSISLAENFVCLLDESFGVPEIMLHTNGRSGLFWNINVLFADLEFLTDGTIAYYIKNKQSTCKGIATFNGVDIPVELNSLRLSNTVGLVLSTTVSDIVDRVRQSIAECD